MFFLTSHWSSFLFALLSMLLKKSKEILLIYMPFLCLHAASLDVTCNNNEKLLCASCSVLLICFRNSLQLPEGSSVVSSNKSNLTSLSHSFFILIAILYSLENSLMERLSSLVHLFYGNGQDYQIEYISSKDR